MSPVEESVTMTESISVPGAPVSFHSSSDPCPLTPPPLTPSTAWCGPYWRRTAGRSPRYRQDPACEVHCRGERGAHVHLLRNRLLRCECWCVCFECSGTICSTGVVVCVSVLVGAMAPRTVGTQATRRESRCTLSPPSPLLSLGRRCTLGWGRAASARPLSGCAPTRRPSCLWTSSTRWAPREGRRPVETSPPRSSMSCWWVWGVRQGQCEWEPRQGG